MATIPGKTLTLPVALDPGALRLWPVSRKLAIMRALCTHLEGITRANGYEFDLAPTTEEDGSITRRVYRGRAVFGDDTPIPCLSVLEGPIPDREPVAVDMEQVVQSQDWVIFVQGWTQTVENFPTDPCYQLMAAVQRRLSEIISLRKSGLPYDPAIYKFGGASVSVAIGPGVVRPPQDQVSSRAFFYLPVVIRLSVDVSQPFVTA